MDASARPEALVLLLKLVLDINLLDPGIIAPEVRELGTCTRWSRCALVSLFVASLSARVCWCACVSAGTVGLRAQNYRNATLAVWDGIDVRHFGAECFGTLTRLLKRGAVRVSAAA